MQTVNRNRFHILVKSYIDSEDGHNVLSTKLVNRMEPVLFNCSRYFKAIKLGCSLSYFKYIDEKRFEQFSNESYLIQFDIKRI